MKTNYLIKHVTGTLLFFSILFISAGRIDYWQGLVYLMIGLVMILLNYTVLRIDAELLNERSKPGEGTKSWDKAILGLSFLMTISMYITAGLDSGRYHWSPDFHWSLCLLGIILTISGQLLFLVSISRRGNGQFPSSQYRYLPAKCRLQALVDVHASLRARQFTFTTAKLFWITA